MNYEIKYTYPFVAEGIVESRNEKKYSALYSDQDKMGGNGNAVAKGATITDVAIVPTDYLSRLDSFRDKASQTSSSLGFKRSDP